jgi:hypothetical protein
MTTTVYLDIHTTLHDRRDEPANSIDLAGLPIVRGGRQGGLFTIWQGAFMRSVQDAWYSGGQRVEDRYDAVNTTLAPGWREQMRATLSKFLDDIGVPTDVETICVLDFELPIEFVASDWRYNKLMRRALTWCIQDLRKLRPMAKVGVFPYPNRTSGYEYEPGKATPAKAANDRLAWLWALVDVTCIDIYPHPVVSAVPKFGEWSVDRWRQFVELQIAEARRVGWGKPVVGFVSLFMVDNRSEIDGTPIDRLTASCQFSTPVVLGIDALCIWGVCLTDDEAEACSAVLRTVVAPALKAVGLGPVGIAEAAGGAA